MSSQLYCFRHTFSLLAQHISSALLQPSWSPEHLVGFATFIGPAHLNGFAATFVEPSSARRLRRNFP